MSKRKSRAHAMRKPTKADRLIVRWNNLSPIIAALRAHLEDLARTDDLLGTCYRAEEFLAAYGLSDEDEHLVTMWGMNKQCVDCGDVKDYYMVNDGTWGAAGLKPDQCCCRRCLTARLERPLNSWDFTQCFINFKEGLLEATDEAFTLEAH